VQALTGALTFLLPVTVGGGPAGNRRLTEILEFAWRSRAVLGNAGAFGWPRCRKWRMPAWATIPADCRVPALPPCRNYLVSTT
jgi:nitrite reductase (NO-forming)